MGGKPNEKAGKVIGKRDELVIACGENSSIRLITVQPEGSKAMSSKQMLCGNKIPLGTVVGE